MTATPTPTAPVGGLLALNCGSLFGGTQGEVKVHSIAIRVALSSFVQRDRLTADHLCRNTWHNHSWPYPHLRVCIAVVRSCRASSVRGFLCAKAQCFSQRSRRTLRCVAGLVHSENPIREGLR